jgi:hypothetical protein
MFVSVNSCRPLPVNRKMSRWVHVIKSWVKTGKVCLMNVGDYKCNNSLSSQAVSHVLQEVVDSYWAMGHNSSSLRRSAREGQQSALYRSSLQTSPKIVSILDCRFQIDGILEVSNKNLTSLLAWKSIKLNICIRVATSLVYGGIPVIPLFILKRKTVLAVGRGWIIVLSSPRSLFFCFLLDYSTVLASVVCGCPLQKER